MNYQKVSKLKEQGIPVFFCMNKQTNCDFKGHDYAKFKHQKESTIGKYLTGLFIKTHLF